MANQITSKDSQVESQTQTGDLPTGFVGTDGIGRFLIDTEGKLVSQEPIRREGQSVIVNPEVMEPGHPYGFNFMGLPTVALLDSEGELRFYTMEQ